MKGKEIKMLNNISNFVKAWRNSKPLEKGPWKMIFRLVFTTGEDGTFIKYLLASIFTKATLLMGWIIKLKIYVVLTGIVNHYYIKIQRIKEKRG